MFNKIREFFCHHFYIFCPKSAVQESQPLEPEVRRQILDTSSDNHFVQTPWGQRTIEKTKYPVRTQDTFNPLRREDRTTDIDYITPMIIGSMIAQDVEIHRNDYGREERTNIHTNDDVSSSHVSVDTSYRSDPTPSYSPSVDSSPSSYDSGSSYSSPSDSSSSYSSPSSDSGSGW